MNWKRKKNHHYNAAINKNLLHFPFINHYTVFNLFCCRYWYIGTTYNKYFPLKNIILDRTIYIYLCVFLLRKYSVNKIKKKLKLQNPYNNTTIDSRYSLNLRFSYKTNKKSSTMKFFTILIYHILQNKIIFLLQVYCIA